MKRFVLGALAALALLAFLPSSLWAHGGQFRGPGGSVPPGLREPTDPTPPPPPPPSGSPPPPTTPSGPTTPTPPPASGPTTPPVPVTPPTPDTGPTRKAQTGVGYQDWTFWYHHNKDDIENLKRMLYGISGSGNPLFQIGGSDVSNRSGATRLTEKKVQEAIIPALIWAMDPKNIKYSDTESAAYLALAKIAKDPAQIKILMKGLDLTPGKERDAIVQESAALAFGLLHRASPDDQFSARELDQVRTYLFSVFENDKYGNRCRGFAALSIGLLGNQPTGSAEYLSANGASLPTTPSAGGTPAEGDEARKAAEMATTRHLFDLLKGDYATKDLSVGLLVALGLQPSRSFTQDMKDLLTECSLKGKLGKQDVDELVQSYAVMTLGRIGGKEDVGVMKNVLASKRSGNGTQRSAAIGLGVLGRTVDSADRPEVAKVLAQAIEKGKDDSVKNFSIISLAYLMIAEVKERKTGLLKMADEILFKQATDGKFYQRPFGAIALGLVCRSIDQKYDIDAWQEFRSKALGILREGIDDQKMDKQGRSAFCVAVGIALDNNRSKRLVEIVGDKHEDKEYRGYAALGLGLIGEAKPEVTRAMADALQERSSEELRRATATALGLLGNPKIGGTGKDAVQLLLEELKIANSQAHKGQVVVALARVGNDKAVDPLVELLKNDSEQDLTRALACAGLGIVGDLEWIPTLSLISKDINYRASCDLIDEVLSIL